MSDKIIENNQVTIMGEVAGQFEFSHEVFGEGFYMVDVLVRRLSNSEDRIPLMISERLIDVSQDYTGEYIMANGQFRSYNRHEEQKNRLILSVFVREVSTKSRTGPRPIRFCWTVISASPRSIGRRLLEERSRTCCLPLTGLMGNRTIFPVSAGDGTPDMRLPLKWESMFRYSAGFRAENM